MKVWVGDGAGEMCVCVSGGRREGGDKWWGLQMNDVERMREKFIHLLRAHVASSRVGPGTGRWHLRSDCRIQKGISSRKQGEAVVTWTRACLHRRRHRLPHLRLHVVAVTKEEVKRLEVNGWYLILSQISVDGIHKGGGDGFGVNRMREMKCVNQPHLP